MEEEMCKNERDELKERENNGKSWEGHFCESDEVNGMPRQSSVYLDYSSVSFIAFLLVCVGCFYIKFYRTKEFYVFADSR